jgi:hypothetical protein
MAGRRCAGPEGSRTLCCRHTPPNALVELRVPFALARHAIDDGERSATVCWARKRTRLSAAGESETGPRDALSSFRGYRGNPSADTVTLSRQENIADRAPGLGGPARPFAEHVSYPPG